MTTELRLRSRIADAAIKTHLAGKVLGAADFDVLLTGATRVHMPDGRPLCVYLPGALADVAADPNIYRVLTSLSSIVTSNRGAASGTKRIAYNRPEGRSGRSKAMDIPSVVLGAVDDVGSRHYCRLTAWTGTHLPEWQTLHPLLAQVAHHLAAHVPDRYAAQLAEADRTDPAWTVPGTPFSTVTVNNTYPTGVHTDKGDLDAGYSTIAVLRRGHYDGGQLVFPAWRVAVDLADGDLLLMDAHQWHGNVTITCACGQLTNGPCRTCGAERISVVAYYRTRLVDCGPPEVELRRAEAGRTRLTAAGDPS
jgi:hypothetical protein